MNKILAIVIIITASFLNAETGKSNLATCQHDVKTFRCVEYIKNYDADTVTFNIPDVHPLLGHKISVRVSGLDTPEIKGKSPCEKDAAKTAQRLVENLLKNAKVINLENIDRDKYFRVLADVVIDGKSLTEILLKNKLAYSYHGETKQQVNWCEFGKTRVPASGSGK